MDIEDYDLGSTIKALHESGGFVDDEHIIYYSFLKPNIDLEFDSRFGIHTSLSRTYSGICDEITFDEVIKRVSSNASPKAIVKDVSFFGPKNNILAIKLESDELSLLHNMLMFELLNFGTIYYGNHRVGSPSLMGYDGNYMFPGHLTPVSKDDGLVELVAVKPSFHISLPKIISLDFVKPLIGKEIDFDYVGSCVRYRGVWKEIKKYDFKK